MPHLTVTSGRPVVLDASRAVRPGRPAAAGVGASRTGEALAVDLGLRDRLPLAVENPTQVRAGGLWTV